MDEALLSEQPVRALQTMLRSLSFSDPSIPRLIPDGTYGPETQAAVSAFQRQAGLPVTGEVDNDVWDAIVLAYLAAERRRARHTGGAGAPEGDYTVHPGQSSPFLGVAGSMFRALSTVLEEIDPARTGEALIGPILCNVRWLQRRGGLSETGILGSTEWDLLSRLYDTFLLRRSRQ